MRSLLLTIVALNLMGTQVAAQTRPANIRLQDFQQATVLGNNTLSTKENSELLGAKAWVNAIGRTYKELSALKVPRKGRGLTQDPTYEHLYELKSKTVVLIFTPEASRVGAGCLISADGQILTNWHVVAGSKEVLFFFYNKSVTKLDDLMLDNAEAANVVASDPTKDLALLKFEAKKETPFLHFAKSTSLRTGQTVLAIGHSESYIWYLTSGIIGQLRDAYAWSDGAGGTFKANVIQTQTTLDPGNSGGPLLDTRGDLIGINSFRIDGPGLNGAVRIDEIDRFVKECNNGMHRTAGSAANPSSQTLTWYQLDLNKNGRVDAYGADSDGDGKYDILKVDENEDGIIDFTAIDSNKDEKIDVFVYDKDGDGRFECFLMDTNHDGIFETVGIDSDGNGGPDKFSELK